MPKDPRPRFNHNNDVLCFACERYRPASEFVWQTCPSLPKPKYSSYCKPCQREMDRLRWCGERRKTNNETRLIRQRHQQQRERMSRKHFMADSILLLRRRGLTKSEIAKLMDVRLASILAWEKRARRVTENATRRIGVVLFETRHLPLQKEPEYRRRLPHPELDALMQRCRPQIRRYPVRDTWKHRRERRAA